MRKMQSPGAKNGESRADGSRNDAAVAAEVAHIRACAANMNLEPEDFRNTLEALDDDCLAKLGLNAYLINYLAAFGDKWPVTEVRRAARQATREKIFRGWEYCRYLAHLGRKADVPRLMRGRAGETVRDFATGNRGVILCTFQFGDCRYGASDVANMGLPAALAMDAESCAQYERFKQANPNAFLWRHLSVVNVENRNGSIALARVLAGRGTAILIVDGNSGADGPVGESSRLEIDFLGCRARVKTGAARLAARFGCPLLPILAPNVDGETHCEIWPALDPKRRLRDGDADRFVEDTMTELYGRFETLVSRHPEQWTVGDRFHRWRTPETPCALSRDGARREVEAALGAGKSLVVDESRVLMIDEGKQTLCTDVRTLKSFRIPAHAQPLAERISGGGGGLNLDWLDRQTGEAREASLAVASMLAARNVLRTVEAADAGTVGTENRKEVIRAEAEHTSTLPGSG